MGKSEEREVQAFLRRIERLASRLSPRTFPTSGLPEFLDYQFQIADLQQEVQQKITETKARVRRDKSLIQHLRQLRTVRWHARRLGDGVAWMVLILDRKTIHALAQNGRVPIASSKDDGSRGVAVTALKLLESGWGLPIIHDITDCLRIGDITFTSFGESSHDTFFRTLEIKTTRMNETKGDRGTTIELQVTAIGTEAFPDLTTGSVPDSIAVPGLSAVAGSGRGEDHPQIRRRNDRRLDKQFDRMTKAVAHRTAESYEMHKVDGVPRVVVESGVKDHSHWSELRRAIRLARKQGYSYFSIDHFLGYGLWYNSTGVNEEDIKRSRFSQDIIASILGQGTEKRNTLTINSIPIAEDDDHSPFLMPFTIYNVPQRAIADILHGRLVISAAINTAPVEQALENAGFTIERDLSSKDPRSFKLRTTLLWPTGEQLYAEVPAPWKEIMTAMHEFQGIESIVSKPAAIRSIPSRIPFADFTSADLNQ